MEFELYVLLILIEELREQLYKVAIDKSFSDAEVVFVSQRLDVLLDRYYELTGENSGDLTIKAKEGYEVACS